jgi:excisionase family DNA binding protein
MARGRVGSQITVTLDQGSIAAIADAITKLALPRLVELFRDIEKNGDPPVMGIDEFAGALKISRSKVKRLIAAGEVRAFKVGKLTKIERAEKERFIKSQSIAA